MNVRTFLMLSFLKKIVLLADSSRQNGEADGITSRLIVFHSSRENS